MLLFLILLFFGSRLTPYLCLLLLPPNIEKILLLGYNKLEVVAATNEYIFCGKSVGAIPTDFFWRSSNH